MSRFTPSSMGMLIPTDDPAALYVCSGTDAAGFKRLPLAAMGGNAMSATLTPKGTLIVVGARGGILRSTDSGATFAKVSSGVSGLLCMVDCFADGRVLAVGDAGTVLLSEDDGASFTRVNQMHTLDTLWCCRRHGDAMLLGGGQGIVMRMV